MSPYRAIPPPPFHCPRCGKQLVAGDVVRCTCGIWVSELAASVVLADDERLHSNVRWWRRRVGCPICGEQMTMRGAAPALFQGCEAHGYWLDADVVPHTRRLGGRIDVAAIARLRGDIAHVEAEAQTRQAVEARRAAERTERQEAEARIERLIQRAPVPELEWTNRPVKLESLAPEESSADELRRRIRELEARVQELEAELAASRHPARR